MTGAVAWHRTAIWTSFDTLGLANSMILLLVSFRQNNLPLQPVGGTLGLLVPVVDEVAAAHADGCSLSQGGCGWTTRYGAV